MFDRAPQRVGNFECRWFARITRRRVHGTHLYERDHEYNESDSHQHHCPPISLQKNINDIKFEPEFNRKM